MKRPLLLALRLAVLAILLAYLGRSLWVDRANLRELEKVASGWAWLALAQVPIGLLLVLTFWRWQLLLQVQGIRYRFSETLAVGFIGFFFNQFIPGSTGGDLVKAYYVAVDHPERRAAGVTTVFLDRVVGLLVVVGMAATALALHWPAVGGDPVYRSLAVLVASVLAGAAAAGALFFSRRLRSRPAVISLLARLPLRALLEKVQGAVYAYRSHPRTVLAVLGISVAVQLSMAGMAICYAMALGGGVDLGTFFFIVPLAQMAMSIPTGAPGGLGQSEIAYRELFQRVGYPHGLLLALLQRLNWALWALVGAVYYFRRRDQVRRARQMAEAAGRGQEESVLGAPAREA